MTKTTEVAVIDLTNTTDAPLQVSLVVGEVEHHIITLGPNESTRQVTPSGVSWKFGPVPQEAESGRQQDVAPGVDGGKGEGSIH